MHEPGDLVICTSATFNIDPSTVTLLNVDRLITETVYNSVPVIVLAEPVKIVVNDIWFVEWWATKVLTPRGIRWTHWRNLHTFS